MAEAGWWRRLRRDIEGNVFFWFIGIATGFALAAIFSQAGGKSFVEMVAVLVGAAAPVAGAVWIARRAEKRIEDRRRLPLATALISIHNAAMKLDRAVSDVIAKKDVEHQPAFGLLVADVRTAYGDLDAFRVLADPSDYQIVVTMRRADEAYAKLATSFDRLLQAPSYVNALFADNIYREVQTDIEKLMDRTGSAATDLLGITLKTKIKAGIAGQSEG